MCGGCGDCGDCVLLFVWEVSKLRECDGDGNSDVGARGCVVAVSARCGCSECEVWLQ